MGKGLMGKRIALAASRKIEEMTTLVEKQEGEVVVRSLQGTVMVAEKEVEPLLRHLIEEGADWVILTTGIGGETLLNMAKQAGIEEPFLTLLKQAKVAGRGYKTYKLLKQWGIEPAARDDDGTTQGLIRSLESCDFKDQKVAVQLHGDPAPKLIRFLEERGAKVTTILPYLHIAPEAQVVNQLCQEIIENKVDAVCFTAAIQVRFFFDYVLEQGLLDNILKAFESNVVAVAVGKVSAEALHDEGITRVLAPEHERMGAMIMELAKYYE